jgi:hypothetical protein
MAAPHCSSLVGSLSPSIPMTPRGQCRAIDRGDSTEKKSRHQHRPDTVRHCRFQEPALIFHQYLCRGMLFACESRGERPRAGGMHSPDPL